MRRARGLALIVVVGVLGVLSVLAVAFVTMAQLERKASQQRVDAANALLLARSGIEDALARLAMGQAASYGGEDWNGDGSLDGPEPAAEVFHPGALDTDSCPVRYAMRPSFFAADSLGLPLKLPVDGRERGYSGFLSGDHAQRGNHYALRVSSQDGFYVNGGDPILATVPGVPPAIPANYNDVLKRILGTLCDAIDREPDGVTPKGNLAAADGWALIDSRPQTTEGWTSFNQIRDLALGGSQAKLDTLKPYLTLSAWVDKSVIRPNATAAMINKLYHSWGEIKLDHDAYPVTAPGIRRSPDFERIPVSPSGKLVGRAPVSLAWARTRRPALIALLADLKGCYFNENAATPFDGNDYIGALSPISIVNTWSATDDCHSTANAILTSTSALVTWQDWDDFCDTLTSNVLHLPTMYTPDLIPNLPTPFGPPPLSALPGLTSDLLQAKRDLLKANFNPNSDLNKFGPNSVAWKSVDKSDLLLYSTEFSLLPKAPRIESVGRVLDRNGRLLASRTLSATLALPSVVRISTQKEFATGDDGGIRQPGNAPYLSLSQGTTPTWGSSRPGLGLGVGLQLYPEPYVAVGGSGTTLSLNAADYDGNLQLATVETRTDDLYGVTATTQVMMMLARFDDGFDLDVWKAPEADAMICQTDVSMVSTLELSNSLWDASKPSTLYPDGAYSERFRCPAYFDKGNSNGLTGLVSFWYKQNSSTDRGLGPRGHRLVNRTNYQDPVGNSESSSPTEIFMIAQGDCEAGIGTGGGFSEDGWMSFIFKTTHRLGEGNRTGYQQFNSGTNVNHPHLWQLGTFLYDFTVLKDIGLVRANDARAEMADNTHITSNDLYPDNATYPASSDITADDSLGRHLASLGQHERPWEYGVADSVGGGADATFDEFAIYDFGSGGGIPSGPVSTFAPARWKEGRYYKEAGYRAPGAPALAAPPGEAGSWVTASILLPAGSILRKIAWTWLRPAALPDDYAELELLNSAGNDYLLDPPGTPAAKAVLSRSTLASGWAPPPNDPQAWDLGRPVPGTFRVRVVFERKAGSTTVNAETPILESPIFDDLTILYDPPGGLGLRVSSWGEGP